MPVHPPPRGTADRISQVRGHTSRAVLLLVTTSDQTTSPLTDYGAYQMQSALPIPGHLKPHGRSAAIRTAPSPVQTSGVLVDPKEQGWDREMAANAVKIGRLMHNQTALFVCDIQERFRPLIAGMPAVVDTARRMVRGELAKKGA